MWRNWNPYTLLVGIQNGTAAMENIVEFPQKIKNKNYHRIQQLHF